MSLQATEFNIPELIQSKMTNRKAIQSELASGKNGQEVLGLSDSLMAKLYGAAYHLFDTKRHAEAINAFLFLANLNPSKHEYWLGLGMSTQLSGNFEGAIDAYEIAALCELDNPTAYFYLAKCLFAIHDRTSALEALELAVEYSEDKVEYAELRQQAKAARDSLLKNE
jgi:type III secretion system low calcium response chaperone LcrH/SycD